MNLLHVVLRMTHGGGMPNVLAEVNALRHSVPDLTVKVVVLEKGISTALMAQAVASGVKVLLAPPPGLLGRLVEGADLTVLHYWNSPAAYRFLRWLAESQTPHRLCLNVHVNGFTPPQVVPAWANAAADAVVHCHPRTPTNGLLPGAECALIPPLMKLPERVALPPVPDFGTFRLFHAGTLNVFKAHPDLIALHEGLAIDRYAFDLWGAGMDAAFGQALAGAAVARYRGFSQNLFADMAPYHLLCNPQAALSYGSFDKIMRESQFMGKPVVVLRESAVADHVLDGVNGRVADDETAYRTILEELAAQPAAYRRLAESTLHWARNPAVLHDSAERTRNLYERLRRRLPKTIRPDALPPTPEEAAFDGLGPWQDALLARPETLTPAELNYALRCEGGLIHFYEAYPENAALRSAIARLQAVEKNALHGKG
jgi:hypothetical protein